MQTYLRRAGVVGKPHVRSFHAVFDAQMRRAPDAGWMAAAVDEHNFFVGPAPARLFFTRASQWGLPFVVLHRYIGDAATMQVRIAGLFEIVSASGPEMTQAETVPRCSTTSASWRPPCSSMPRCAGRRSVTGR